MLNRDVHSFKASERSGKAALPSIVSYYGTLHFLLTFRSVPPKRAQAISSPSLDAAVGKLSLEEKAHKEEPLSKAQAKRLRKKLREGRAEL